jgi:hypothetical protein
MAGRKSQNIRRARGRGFVFTLGSPGFGESKKDGGGGGALLAMGHHDFFVLRGGSFGITGDFFGVERFSEGFLLIPGQL